MKQYRSTYDSPLGEIVLTAEDEGLTGYAGGISKKVELLKLEGAWQDGFFVPKRGTAP